MYTSDFMSSNRGRGRGYNNNKGRNKTNYSKGDIRHYTKNSNNKHSHKKGTQYTEVIVVEHQTKPKLVGPIEYIKEKFKGNNNNNDNNNNQNNKYKNQHMNKEEIKMDENNNNNNNNKNNWSCSFCTFNNEKLNEKCVMCDNPKKIIIKKNEMEEIAFYRKFEKEKQEIENKLKENLKREKEMEEKLKKEKEKNKELNKALQLKKKKEEEKEEKKEEKGIILSNLLQKWDLNQYKNVLISEEGYEDIEDCFDLTLNELKQIGFKSGHAKKFKRKMNEYFKQIRNENNQDNDDNYHIEGHDATAYM